MTKEQRERLSYLTGMLYGLTWAVEDCTINEGLCDVVTSLESLLKEDEKDENA